MLPQLSFCRITSHNSGITHTASQIETILNPSFLECEARFKEINGTESHTIEIAQKSTIGLGETASLAWMYEEPAGLTVDEKLDDIEKKLYKLLYYFDIRTN